METAILHAKIHVLVVVKVTAILHAEALVLVNAHMDALRVQLHVEAVPGDVLEVAWVVVATALIRAPNQEPEVAVVVKGVLLVAVQNAEKIVLRHVVYARVAVMETVQEVQVVLQMILLVR